MKAFKQKEKPTKRFSNSFGNNESKLSQFSGIGDSGHNPVIHKKLMIGEPNDKHEIEAENVANRAVNQPERTLQMQPIEEEEEALQMQPLEEEEEMLQMQPLEEEEELIQPKCKECEEREKMRMKPKQHSINGNSSLASPQISNQIESSKGKGSPLDTSTNREMSQKIGHDFSGVRIHTGSKSKDMNQSLGARAFTVGNDIFFNSNQYSPESRSGKRLLAHELVHTVQQSNRRRIQRVPSYGAAAPAQPNWQVVPNDERNRVNAALNLIGNVVNNDECTTYFEDNCTDGRGANSLQHAYDNAVVYNLNTNDTTYGSSINGSNDIAYNNTSYNIGRWFLASTLLHEMFHTCDPTIDAQDEIDAENAIETCRLYTPILSNVAPASAAVGDAVTLTGVSFGASQRRNDKVYFNNIEAGVATKWGYAGTPGSSQGEIIVNVPAGATSGIIRVVNNGVSSNEKPFTVNAGP